MKGPTTISATVAAKSRLRQKAVIRRRAIQRSGGWMFASNRADARARNQYFLQFRDGLRHAIGLASDAPRQRTIKGRAHQIRRRVPCPLSGAKDSRERCYQGGAFRGTSRIRSGPGAPERVLPTSEASRPFRQRIGGRGEWIRTTDLLVPKHKQANFHTFSTISNWCERLRVVASYQRLAGCLGPGVSKAKQRFYAGGGHKNGHSL